MERSNIMYVILLFCFVHTVTGQADTVQYIANNVVPKFSVMSNWASNDPDVQIFEAELQLSNTGDTGVSGGDWQIFFCHIRLFEPGILTPNYTQGIPVGNTGLELYHINGCLYKLQPTVNFELPAQETIKATVTSSDWMVARTDIMPNWYVSTEDGAPTHIMKGTVGEDLPHVGEFDTPEKWKRMSIDLFDPPSPEERYNEYAEDEGSSVKRLVPNPVSVSLDWNTPINTDNTWRIVRVPGDTDNEADYLEDKTGWTLAGSEPSDKFVNLVLDPNTNLFDDTSCENNSDEAYHMKIDEASKSVVITATTNAGVFYGIQTCLGMLALGGDDGFYPGTIVDCPRFPFRGFMIDVSRNFVANSTILDMLNVMAMYKLNKFHFHLSDDEGWRLEIPELPELTEIGSKRCHNLEEDQCIIPQLGSGPTEDFPGTGYYSAADYIEILQEATRLHIEVIPEFDMPGHAHAAIKAMEARYKDNNDTEYLLSDFDDKSLYYSAQHFWDSALNPCLNSTATFITKVMQKVHDLHATASHSLSFYHFGGDEVPVDAWKGSPICQQFMEDMGFDDNSDLKRYFFQTVLNASAEVDPNMGLGSWEDGVMDANDTPFEVDTGAEVYTNCWSNVWEWGHGERAYRFANADYKVVLSHVTHLYFDHPQESDPHERGYYWGTRFTAAEKTFGYMPDDIYANIEIDRMGNTITEEDVCPGGCEPLDPTKRHNIIGMQGQLFSETTRSEEILHGMVLPRMISLAERAWHKAPWEDISNSEDRNIAKREDWVQFANHLGHNELLRLEDRAYHLRPPGAIVNENGQLVAKAEFPGLVVEYKINDAAWQDFSTPVTLAAGSTVKLRTSTPEKTRNSEEATLTVGTQGCSAVFPTLYLLVASLLTLAIVKIH